MKITSFIFRENLDIPVKFLLSTEKEGKFSTQKGYFTVKTMRQKNQLANIAKDQTIEQAIKLHEAEYGTP